MLKNISVGAKIILGFAISLALLVFVGIVGTVGLSKQHTVTSQLLHTNLQYGMHLIDARKQVGDLRRFEKDLFLNFDSPEKTADYHDKWQKSFAALQTELGNAKKIATPEQATKIEALIVHSEAYGKGEASIMADIKAGKFTSPQEINNAFNQFKDPIRLMSETLTELTDAALKNVQSIDSQVDAIKGQVTTTLITLILSAIAIGVACAYIIYQSIRKPLASMQNTIAEIDRSGRISMRMPIENNDEIGQTSTAMNQLLGNMCNVIGAANRCSNDLVQSARELTSAANQVSNASGLQSEASSATAAAIEEMSVSVHLIADNSSQLQEETRLVVRTAEEGSAVAGKTTGQIQQIANSINKSNELIGQLNHRSDEIGSIVLVIKDIADQTNLLALNAAIEAARAGDLGRGFAVVADEVRKLAERTTQATLEITSKIQAVQHDTSVAAKGMFEASSLVEIGVRSSHEMAEALAQIKALAHRNVEHISSITGAIHEQSSASQEIAKNVERIAQAGEENSSAAKSACELSNRLNALASRLDTTIQTFKV
nr:methyl-accepting chemotaxis protein [uncultured Deefgea sp.]